MKLSISMMSAGHFFEQSGEIAQAVTDDTRREIEQPCDLADRQATNEVVHRDLLIVLRELPGSNLQRSYNRTRQASMNRSDPARNRAAVHLHDLPDLPIGKSSRMKFQQMLVLLHKELPVLPFPVHRRLANQLLVCGHFIEFRYQEHIKPPIH